MCRTFSSPQQWGTNLYRSIGQAGHVDQLDDWRCSSQKRVMSRLIQSPTTLNKRVWICYICYKQIHVRKQISIRCNRIEHLVHHRFAGIRQAQYTDSWTYHPHRESSLTIHIDTTPRHSSRPWSPSPLLTPHLHHPHHRNQNIDTRPTLPLFPQDW